MAFDPNDFEELVRLMRDDPDLRDRLRRLILTEELLRMPVTLSHMAETMEQLVATSSRHTEQFEETEARLERIDRQLELINERLDRLDARANSVEGNMGRVMGLLFESKFIDELPNRLAKHFRKVRRILPGDFAPLLKRLDEDDSFERDFDDVVLLDVLATGVRRGDAEGRPVYAAIEISRSVAATDVERVARRAAILRNLDLDVVAVVAGETVRDDVRQLADSVGVVVLPQKGEPEPA